MASLVLKMSVSLDGYVARVDGSLDWIAATYTEDATEWTVDTLSNASTHVMGATTYQAMAAYWPDSTQPYAKPMNEIPKAVFSNSLESADWGDTQIVRGELAAGIERLKSESSATYLLAHGGARFVRSLIETGLVDEFRLLVHPAVLGAGEPIFTESLALEPISTTAFDGGTVAHVFGARACAPPLGSRPSKQ